MTFSTSLTTVPLHALTPRRMALAAATRLPVLVASPRADGAAPYARNHKSAFIAFGVSIENVVDCLYFLI